MQPIKELWCYEATLKSKAADFTNHVIINPSCRNTNLFFSLQLEQATFLLNAYWAFSVLIWERSCSVAHTSGYNLQTFQYGIFDKHSFNKQCFYLTIGNSNRLKFSRTILFVQTLKRRAGK